MQNDGAEQSDGVLHPVLRGPRRRQIPLVQLHVERPRSPRRGDAQLGQEPTAVEELKRVGSLHHAGSSHVGLPATNRQRRRVGDPVHLHAVDEERAPFSGREKPMGRARDQRTLPDRVPSKIRIRYQPVAGSDPDPEKIQPLHFRRGDPEKDPERLPRGANELL